MQRILLRFQSCGSGGKICPTGDYVSRKCRELAKLPAAWIHQPHCAPLEILCAAGVELGRDYPRSIVSHGIVREVALEAFARIRSASAGGTVC